MADAASSKSRGTVRPEAVKGDGALADEAQRELFCITLHCQICNKTVGGSLRSEQIAEWKLDFKGIKDEMQTRFRQRLMTVHEEKEPLRRGDMHNLEFWGKDDAMQEAIAIEWLKAHKQRHLSKVEGKERERSKELEDDAPAEGSTRRRRKRRRSRSESRHVSESEGKQEIEMMASPAEIRDARGAAKLVRETARQVAGTSSRRPRSPELPRSAIAPRAIKPLPTGVLSKRPVSPEPRKRGSSSSSSNMVLQAVEASEKSGGQITITEIKVGQPPSKKEAESPYEHAEEIRRHLSYIDEPHLLVSVLKMVNGRMAEIRVRGCVVEKADIRAKR
jgi:hypothetical protein